MWKLFGFHRAFAAPAICPSWRTKVASLLGPPQSGNWQSARWHILKPPHPDTWPDPLSLTRPNDIPSFYADWRSVADVSLNVNRVAGFWQFQNLTDIMCGKGSITNDQQWSICHSQQTSANYELTLWKVGQWYYYAGQPSRLQKGTAWLMPQTVKPRSNFLLSLPDQISTSPSMAIPLQQYIPSISFS